MVLEQDKAQLEQSQRQTSASTEPQTQTTQEENREPTEQELIQADIERIEQKSKARIEQLKQERADLARRERENPRVSFQAAIKRKNVLIKRERESAFRAIDTLKFRQQSGKIPKLGKTATKRLKNEPFTSIKQIIKDEQKRIKDQAAAARRSSQRSAQSAAISAAGEFAKDPAGANIKLSNFGGKGVTPVSASLQERISKIQPETPRATPSVFGKTLTVSENRPRVVGVDTGQSIRKPESLEQKQKQSLVSFFSQLKTPEQPSEGILTGVVEEATGKQPTANVKTLIKDLSRRPETFTLHRSAVIRDPKTGEFFDTKTGIGSVKIGLALGFKFRQDVPEPIKTETVSVATPGPQVQTKPKTTLTNIALEESTKFLSETQKKLKLDPSDPISIARQPLAAQVGLAKGVLVTISEGSNLFEKLKGVSFRGSPVTDVKLDSDLLKDSFANFISRLKVEDTGKPPIRSPDTVFGRVLESGSIENVPTSVIEYSKEFGVAGTAGEFSELAIGGGFKSVQTLGQKLTQKFLKKFGKVPDQPTVDPSTGKIFPKNQQQLTREQVNVFESESITVGKGSPTKGIGIRPTAKTVQIDKDFRPSTRANEIDFSQDNVLTDFSTKKVKLGRGQTDLAAKETPPKPFKVETDADKLKSALSSDDAVAGFTQDKLRLGRGQTDLAGKDTPTKVPKVVEEDPTFRPSTRANEIDITKDDILTDFSKTRIRLGKAETDLAKKDPPPKPFKVERDADKLKKSLERDDALAGFGKEEKGLGKSITQQSGQKTILIKKNLEISRKKLKNLGIENKRPVSTVFTKEETRLLPPTGRSPLIPRAKSKKKRKTQSATISGVAVTQPSAVIITSRKPGEKLQIQNKKGSEIPLRQDEIIISGVRQKQRQPQSEIVRLAKIEELKIKDPQTTVTKQRTALSSPTPIRPRQTAQSKGTRTPRKRQTARILNRIPNDPSSGLRRPVASLPRDTPERKRGRTKKKKKKPFVGNVSDVSIVGVFGRKEISFDKKTLKKSKKDDDKILSAAGRKTKNVIKKSKVKIF